MKNPKKRKLRVTGTFRMPDGQETFGTLDVNGPKTTLRVDLKHKLLPFTEPAVIKGELGDLRKITCSECIIRSTSAGYQGDGQHYHAEIFPHFVAVGGSHLDPSEPSIKSVEFTIQDVLSVFHDFDAFGHIIDAKSAINTLEEHGAFTRDIVFGDQPEIFYFSGKHEVIVVDTEFGFFRVFHRPVISGGGSNGKFIKNQIVLSLEFAQPIAFDACINRLMSIHRFLSLVAGRQQSMEHTSLELTSHDSRLELHWMYAPINSENERDQPRPGDIPLDAVRRPKEFATVLTNWLSRDQQWGIARIRHARGMEKSNVYSVDRLVAAANTFDILPNDALPTSLDLTPELINAQKQCREIFRNLPVSIERDSVLGALGRMNKSSLTKKVLHRVAKVNASLALNFPDLELVAATAVKVRNFFVHGGSGSQDYDRLQPLIPFLTDTLEFVFAASDLIEAGWDVVSWGNKPFGYGHCFTRFRWGYQEQLMSLKEALG